MTFILSDNTSLEFESTPGLTLSTSMNDLLYIPTITTDMEFLFVPSASSIRNADSQSAPCRCNENLSTHLSKICANICHLESKANPVSHGAQTTNDDSGERSIGRGGTLAMVKLFFTSSELVMLPFRWIIIGLAESRRESEEIWRDIYGTPAEELDEY